MPTTYILTWNPSLWEWKDYNSAIAQVARGETYEIDWSSGNTKKIRAGDRLFMLRQNSDRGIIAAGRASSDCFQGKHWNESGRDANYVKFRVEQMLSVSQRLRGVQTSEGRFEPVTNGARTVWDHCQTDVTDLNCQRNRSSGISERAPVALDFVPCPDSID